MIKKITTFWLVLIFLTVIAIPAWAGTQWVAYRTGTTYWWSPNEIYYGGEYADWTVVKAHAAFRWDANRINTMIAYADSYGYVPAIHYDDESSPWPAYPSSTTYFTNLPGFFYFTDPADHEANFVVTYPRGLTPGAWYETKAYYTVSHMVEGWINVSGYELDIQSLLAWGREWLAKLIYRGYYGVPQFRGQPAIGKSGSEAESELPPISYQSDQQTIVKRGEGPGYRYIVIEREKEILLIIVFTPKTLEELQQYVAENRKLAAALISEGYNSVPVVITFREPIAFSQAAYIIDRSGLLVETYYLRGYVNGGKTPQDRFTASCAPTEAGFCSESDLRMLTEDLQEAGGKDFAGVISIKGKLPSSSLEWLSELPEVFLVDLMGQMLMNYVVKGFRQDKPVRVLLESPYWFIENFRRQGQN